MLNKPRCRYECGNDIEAEIINYLLVIKQHPKEIDELKQGVFGLVSQEICNRIVRGELLPQNNIERAYFFYYLNKLTFGGSVSKGYGYMIDNHNLSREGYGRVDSNTVENAKQEYEWKTKGFGGIINPRATPQNTLHDNDFEKIKSESPYRGVILPTVCKQKSVKDAKLDYKSITPRKEHQKAQIKGINPKTTRPYTNNDCGLLSPLNPEAIKRLRYVNLTCYPFDKVYKMFYEAFHIRKGLGPECFIYFDPPYPGTEKYYRCGFSEEDHKKLIQIFKESPFHCLLSIGCECQMYLDELKDFIIVPVKVKYSTDANSQVDKQEYLIMNYEINQLPLMKEDVSQKTIEGYIKPLEV